MVWNLQDSGMPLRQLEAVSRRLVWSFSYFAVAAFGFCLVWFSGHRGLFLADQSMIFDGAWRLSQGQVPYRDIFFPFGPITFAIQAGFFKVFGVSFSSTVLSAAVLNALAGLLTIRIINRLLSNQKVIALIGGLVTTCWFQAPFGTLWLEQTAFFFGFLALFFVVESDLYTKPRSYWFHTLGGILIALSTLSKQNSGVLFFPVIAGVATIAHFREPSAALKRLGVQVSGFVLGMACFLLWLWLFSSPQQYFHYSIEISRSLAAERTPRLVNLVETLLTLSSVPLHVRWCALFFALMGIAAILAGLVRWPRSESQARDYMVTGWIIIACLQFQQVFTIVTFNDAENNLPFLGLVGGLAMGLLSHWLGRKDLRFSLSSGKESFQATLPRQVGRRIVLTASILLLTAPIVHGVRTSWKRTVQQFRDESRFTGTLSTDGLHGLKWADFEFPGSHSEPESQWLRKSDFEALNAWLAMNPGNFFVFPDATILYGLHRRPSPQPWLYFQEGHSFLRSELPNVDETVVMSLRRSAIRAIVLEKVSWNSQRLLLRMPKLRTWINDNFTKEKEIGIFEVWTANSN